MLYFVCCICVGRFDTKPMHERRESAIFFFFYNFHEKYCHSTNGTGKASAKRASFVSSKEVEGVHTWPILNLSSLAPDHIGNVFKESFSGVLTRWEV